LAKKINTDEKILNEERATKERLEKFMKILIEDINSHELRLKKIKLVGISEEEKEIVTGLNSILDIRLKECGDVTKKLQELPSFGYENHFTDKAESIKQNKIFLAEVFGNSKNLEKKVLQSEKTLKQNKLEFEKLQQEAQKTNVKLKGLTEDINPLWKKFDKLDEDIEDNNSEMERLLRGIESQRKGIAFLLRYLPGKNSAVWMYKMDKGVKVVEAAEDLSNSLSDAKLKFKRSLEEADALSFKTWVKKYNLPKLKEIEKAYGSEYANFINEKANINADLPNLQEIAKEVTINEKAIISETIDAKIIKFLDSELDELVKGIAHNVFQEIWHQEEGLEKIMENYFENEEEKLVNAAESLL
jgi:hypothetical protein